MRIRGLRYLTRLISFLTWCAVGSVARYVVPAPFLYCHSCPLALGICPIGAIQYALTMGRVPLLPVGALLLYGTLLGRAYCGLMCPIGALQDALHWLGRRLGISSERVRRVLSSIPYWVAPVVSIVLTVVLPPILGTLVFCYICISGFLLAGIPWRVILGELGIGLSFLIHLVVFVTFAILALLGGRFWCRLLCPFSVLGLCNSVRLFLRLKVDYGRCTKCLRCLGMCPMSIGAVEDVGTSPHCISCLLCSEVCPQKAVVIEM